MILGMHSDSTYILRDSPFLFLVTTGGIFAKIIAKGGVGQDVRAKLVSAESILDRPTPETTEGLTALAVALVMRAVVCEFDRDRMSSAGILSLYDQTLLYNELIDISDRIRSLEAQSDDIGN